MGTPVAEAPAVSIVIAARLAMRAVLVWGTEHPTISSTGFPGPAGHSCGCACAGPAYPRVPVGAFERLSRPERPP